MSTSASSLSNTSAKTANPDSNRFLTADGSHETEGGGIDGSLEAKEEEKQATTGRKTESEKRPLEDDMVENGNRRGGGRGRNRKAGLGLTTNLGTVAWAAPEMLLVGEGGRGEYTSKVTEISEQVNSWL